MLKPTRFILLEEAELATSQAPAPVLVVQSLIPRDEAEQGIFNMELPSASTMQMKRKERSMLMLKRYIQLAEAELQTLPMHTRLILNV
jgi:hypothetical protein